MSDYLKLGLLGHPLEQSLSPILQTAALQFAGIKGEYRLFDIEPAVFEQKVKEILAEGINGFNITIPHKQSIYKMVDHYIGDASQVGAINTVKVESDGKLSGHNTDVIGFKLAFAESFADNVIGDKKIALIIGAGGGAKAVVVALAQLGYKNIIIKGRNPQKVRSFIAQMETNLAQVSSNTKISSQEDDQEKFVQLNLIVNASPLGIKDEAVPEWLNQLINKLNDQCLCFDLVYGKDGNKPMFTKLALQRRLNAVDGLPMLIHQARYAFEFWTGITVPSAIMYEALL